MDSMATQETILVTGGMGFIGSHTTLELLKKGFKVIILDNLVNSSQKTLERIKEVSGLTEEARDTVEFVNADILDRDALNKVFDANPSISTVIHFAGLKAVGESVRKPWEYYNNNITGTLILLDVMRKHNCYKMVFSSSATVYGDAKELPVKESAKVNIAENPYGNTKLFIEQILRDMVKSEPEKWSIVLLRYFNPTGAHPSGRMGEDPQGVPANLAPYVAQVAVGKRECLSVFGDDYPTPDGTGVRDYIHVSDLADGHLASLAKLKEPGCYTYNLGTGRGYSVLEMIAAVKKASAKEIKYKVVKRREGDVAANYADATKAKKELNWEAKRDLEEMCTDLWRWQSNNPNGYDS